MQKVDVSVREKVFSLEEKMRSMEQIDVPIFHYFSQGKVYGREMRIPKGSTIIGEIHKYEQLNILSKGDVTVVTEDGPMRVTAGFHMVAPPGAKRAFYAHEDSIWTVIHGTEETDVDKIEDHFIAKSENEYRIFLDKCSHEQFLLENNFSQDFATLVSENNNDRVDIDNLVGVVIEKSERHGLGVFADTKFSAGDCIAPALIDGKRTQIGRYANHSESPNAVMKLMKNGDINLAAIEDIEPGEILVNYRDALSLRSK